MRKMKTFRPDAIGRIDWPAYVNALVGRGWTIAGIAEAAEVARNSVHDLRNGRTLEPRYAAGVRMLLLQSREPVGDRRIKVE